MVPRLEHFRYEQGAGNDREDHSQNAKSQGEGDDERVGDVGQPNDHPDQREQS